MKPILILLIISVIFNLSGCTHVKDEIPLKQSDPDTKLDNEISDLSTTGITTTNATELLPEIPPDDTPNELDIRFGLEDYSAQLIWQSVIQCPLTIVVGPDGRIYTRQCKGGAVEIDPVSGSVKYGPDFDATARKAMSEFSGYNGIDTAISPDGVEYQAIWNAGSIMRNESDGKWNTIVTGLSVNDPISLDFGPDGMLYFTDRKYTFASVSPDGGPITSYDFLKNIQSESLSLKDFAFEPSGEVVFANTTSSNIIRANLETERVEIVVEGNLNSPALAITPSGEIYAGRTAEFPIKPSTIVKIRGDGTSETVAEVPGLLRCIACDQDGTLYGASHQNYPDLGYDEFWIFKVFPDGTTETIINRSRSSDVYQFRTLCVDPVSGDLVGFDIKTKKIIRISKNGGNEHSLSPPVIYPIWSSLVTVDSNGTIWQLVVPEKGQFDGPSVNRELYHIFPDGQINLVTEFLYGGCCTMEAMTVGSDNAAYIILSPEFKMVRVFPDGKVEGLAGNLPIDPLGIAVGENGNIVFSSAEGVFLLKPEF